MRCKKASQNEQQNQTTTTTKINYIKKMSVLKNKVKIASDKTDIKQINLYFTRKDMGVVNEKSW